jgi:hypothetical protein
MIQNETYADNFVEVCGAIVAGQMSSSIVESETASTFIHLQYFFGSSSPRWTNVTDQTELLSSKRGIQIIFGGSDTYI